MKNIFFAIALLTLVSVTAYAQTAPPKPAPTAAPVSPLLKGRQLTSQLAGGLDAATFLNSWTPYQQSQWYSGLTKVPDAASLAKSISTLTEFISPAALKEGFNLASLRGLAAEAENFGDVANILGTLESNIKPEAFKNDWVATEQTWIGELKLVK